MGAVKTNRAGARIKSRRADNELKQWNRVSRVDSYAITLFALMARRLRPGQGDDTRFVRDRNPLIRIRAYEDVIAELTSKFGSCRVAWGEVNRLQRPLNNSYDFSDSRSSLPVPGGVPSHGGIFFTFYTSSIKDQKRYYGTLGHSYVSVVEFGPKVRALSVEMFGQSSDPKSVHFFDQAPLYAKGQFKPALLSLSEIKSMLNVPTIPAI